MENRIPLRIRFSEENSIKIDCFHYLLVTSKLLIVYSAHLPTKNLEIDLTREDHAEIPAIQPRESTPNRAEKV